MKLTHPLVLLLSLLALLALVAPPAADAARKKPRAGKAQTCQNADLMPSASNIGQIKSATLCLLNNERAANGLKALSTNGQLAGAAQSYSAQMVRESFFDHVSPSGSTLLSRIKRSTKYLQGARSYLLGENLAWGSGDRATPRQTVIAWMNSAGHRRNILDKGFKQIGIGVALGAPSEVGNAVAATYTTEFGRRS